MEIDLVEKPQPAARFDRHSGPISGETPVTKTYRSTQNVRRYLTQQCGDAFKFDRDFMRWIKDGTTKTMGDVAREGTRRNAMK